MKRLGIALMTLAAVLILAAPAVAKKKKTNYIERFKAIATSVQAGTGGMDVIRFGVKEWTTADERKAMIAAFDEGGSDALARWLGEQSEKAVITTPEGRPYSMMYAYQFTAGGKRTVVLGTDRPISGLESLVGTQRSLRYNISLAILEFEEGAKKGTGQMVLGAEITFNRNTNTLTIEGMGLQPIRFTSVKDEQK